MDGWEGQSCDERGVHLHGNPSGTHLHTVGGRAGGRERERESGFLVEATSIRMFDSFHFPCRSLRRLFRFDCLLNYIIPPAGSVRSIYQPLTIGGAFPSFLPSLAGSGVERFLRSRGAVCPVPPSLHLPAPDPQVPPAPPRSRVRRCAGRGAAGARESCLGGARSRGRRVGERIRRARIGRVYASCLGSWVESELGVDGSVGWVARWWWCWPGGSTDSSGGSVGGCGLLIMYASTLPIKVTAEGGICM